MKRLGDPRIVLPLLVGVAILLSVALELTVLQRFELNAYDFLMRVTEPQTVVDPRMRVLALDDTSLSLLKDWPWPRSRHGEMLDTLRRGGAHAALIDIMFLEKKDQLQDLMLSSALKQFKKDALAYEAGPDNEFLDASPQYPFEEVRNEAAAIGYVDVSKDMDGVLRRVRLGRKIEGRMRPSLDLATFALVNDVRPDDIVFGDREIRVGQHVIKTDEYYQIMIPYFTPGVASGPVVRMLLTPIPYVRALPEAREFAKANPLLEPLSEAEIKDGIFLVGPTASGLKDNHQTPMGDMSGILIHANIFNGLLTGFTMRSGPPWAEWVLLIALPAVLAVPLSRMRALSGMFVAFLVLLALWICDGYWFSQGVWIPVVGPSLSLLLTTIVIYGYHFFRSHQLLGKFVAPEVADALLKTHGEDVRYQEDKEVTIAFSDIRGFTTLSESMPPAQMRALLDEYHTLTVAIWSKHGGRCNSYLGDAQMVIFGHPKVLPNHAASAIRASCEVQEVIADLGRKRLGEGRAPFEVGIGLCTGVAAVGILGSAEHVEYTAIGDATNTASRVQGLSRELDSPILITESTLEKAGGGVEAEFVQEVSLKGKEQKVKVYRVKSCKPEGRAGVTAGLVSTLLAGMLLASGCGGQATAPPSPSPVAAKPSAVVVYEETQPAPSRPPAAKPSPAVMPSPAAPAAKPSPAAKSSPAPQPPPVVAQQPLPPAPPGGAPPKPASPPAKKPGGKFAELDVPIYPLAKKKVDHRTISEGGQGKKLEHVTLVLTTPDSLDQVAKWYKAQMKPSIVMERKSAAGPVVELTAAPAGRQEDLPPATVVLQQEATKGTQITLSTWQPAR